MFRTAARSWVCSSCVKRQYQLRRGLGTASSYYQPRPIPVDSSAPGAQHDDRTLRQIFDSKPFWREFSQSSNLDHTGRSSGLFQIRYLTNPEGFETFASVTLRKADRIVQKILSASSNEEYKCIVKDLDRLSDLLCRVIDSSDFVRATHPDIKINDAASKAYSMMFEYMNKLNTMPGLDQQLAKALSIDEVVASWTEEERAVADILKRDFKKSAFEQPQKGRDRFVALHQELNEVGTNFVAYSAAATQMLSFPSSRLKGMDPVLVGNHTKWNQTKFRTFSGFATAALRYAEDEAVRREVFMANKTASSATIGRLEDMLRIRNELAKLSRYESFADMILEDKMAKSPESVNQFLQALTVANRALVTQEKQQLNSAKIAHLGANDPLKPWDKDYYMAKVLSSVPRRTKSPDFLSSYFSLGTVMQGLSRLFTRLYGIRFAPREASPGETWNPDVRRLDVMSETDGHVAVLYCDLFSRAGKSPNPAHFTLRCSREISEAELEEVALGDTKLFSSNEEAANDGMSFSKASGALKQLPTIALICDFDAGHPTRGGATRPSLLSFSEVSTLFHEMGHAIHSIIGRTSLQNVSGTRCATDFAELPSVLLEHFAEDPSVLALFARHWETDQALPHGLIAEKVALDKRFEGTETETQIIMSMMDQAYHSSLPGRDDFNSTNVYHQLQTQHGVMPTDPEGTCWQGFFGHLHGYGSTYYSYLFDRVLARRIWKVVFRNGHDGGGIDRAAGERMKEEVLKWGGGRDPWKCLADVLKDGRVEKGGKEAMGIVGTWGLRDVREKL